MRQPTSFMDWIVPNKQTTKGGDGSGYFGHAGRPGLVGGSAPGENHRAGIEGIVALGKRDDSYTVQIDGGTAKIVKVRGGTVLPSDVDEKLRSFSDGVRVTFNTETSNWHIALGDMQTVNHGDFVVDALESHKPEATEFIQARGVYDIATNTLALYDFTGFMDGGDQMQSKRFDKRIKDVLKRAQSYVFYIRRPDGKVVKPVIEIIPFSEISP